jgi:hypothetical protein
VIKTLQFNETLFLVGKHFQEGADSEFGGKFRVNSSCLLGFMAATRQDAPISSVNTSGFHTYAFG